MGERLHAAGSTRTAVCLIYFGFPCGSDGKESDCNVGDSGSIPGLGQSPGEGNGNPLQYSCLENPMDRGAWQTTVHGVAELDTTEWLRYFHYHSQGFPSGSTVKKFTCQCRRCRFYPWVGKIPWRRKLKPTPIMLLGEVPWTEESSGPQSMGSQVHEHALPFTYLKPSIPTNPKCRELSLTDCVKDSVNEESPLPTQTHIPPQIRNEVSKCFRRKRHP